jgi:hypothetical protein
VAKFRVVLKPREKIKRLVVVPLLLEVTKHIDLMVLMFFWENLVGVAVAVVVGVAVAATEARLMA